MSALAEGPLFWWVTQVRHRNHFTGCQDQCPNPVFYLISSNGFLKTQLLQKDFPDSSYPLQLITPLCRLLPSPSVEVVMFICVPALPARLRALWRQELFIYAPGTEYKLTVTLNGIAGNAVAGSTRTTCLLINQFFILKAFIENPISEFECLLSDLIRYGGIGTVRFFSHKAKYGCLGKRTRIGKVSVWLLLWHLKCMLLLCACIYCNSKRFGTWWKLHH